MAYLRLASLCLVLLLGATDAMAQARERNIYCCDNDQGNPVCGDVLPAACYGQAYRVISPQGTVRRFVAAPMSAEEIARRDEEERLRREEEARALAQRRLDEALLETYTGLEEIDLREERALADVERSVEDIREREIELIEQRGRLRQEAEFYEGRDLPHEIATGLRLIEAELRAYRSVLEAKEAEKAAIRSRYAADRRRYAELLAAGMKRR